MRYLYVLFLLFLFSGLAPARAQRLSALARLPADAVRPDSTTLPLLWRVRDRTLRAGAMEHVDFLAFNFRDIAAYQFALRFDKTQLKFEGIDILTPDLPLDPSGNFGLFNIAGGEIRTLWAVAKGYTLPPATPVFRLRFTTLVSGKKLREVLYIDPDIITPVAYNTVLADRPLELIYADFNSIYPRSEDNTAVPAPSLLPNYPNPFTGSTHVGFDLPAPADIRLCVFDGSGRELWRIEQWYPAGHQEETIRLDESAPTGILFYELTTPFGVLTRKMVATR